VIKVEKRNKKGSKLKRIEHLKRIERVKKKEVRTWCLITPNRAEMGYF